jgi:hypothetical protein
MRLPAQKPPRKRALFQVSGASVPRKSADEAQVRVGRRRFSFLIESFSDFGSAGTGAPSPFFV